ncbi:MAG: hypothetical protein A4E47_00011 [Methanosaeta sp. PtaU1.Bin028]|nr:MAG: hypothetical protein A4E47_00011 [Methanosaeta sp. PtaU1.Bin028]
MRQELILCLTMAAIAIAAVASSALAQDDIELYIIGFDITQGSSTENSLIIMAQQLGGVYLSAENAKTPDDLSQALNQSYKGVISPKNKTLGQATTAPTTEAEQNDCIGDATAVSIGQPVSGSIFPKQDVDFYKVFVSDPGILKVSLKDVPRGIAGSMKGEICYWNRNPDYVGCSGAANPGDDVAYEADITSPGWYYFRIRDLNGGSYNSSYTFVVTFDPVVDIGEPNGCIGDATEVQLNKSVEGFIFSKGDVDFYKVFVSDPGILKASLKDVPREVAGSMKGEICYWNRNPDYVGCAGAPNPGDDVAYEVDITSPGWYYFRIRDLNGGSYGVSYTFEVTSQV